MFLTSSGEAKNCHTGTSRALDNFSKVGEEGSLMIRDKFSLVIPNTSAKPVIVYPFSLITSLILFSMLQRYTFLLYCD